MAIADRIEDQVIETGVYHLPVFTCPEETDVEAYRNSFSEDEFRLRYEVMGRDEKPRGLNDDAKIAKLTEDAHLAELCDEGMLRSYGEHPTDEAKERFAF